MRHFLQSSVCTYLSVGFVLGLATACVPESTEPIATANVTTDSQISLASSSLGPTVAKGLASLRHATAAFHDVNVAIAAGYANPTGMPCVASQAGTMGIHSVRGASLDQVVVPNAPEVMLYLPTKGAGFRLVGVEYLVPALVRNTITGAVSPWFAETPWGADYVLITPRPSIFGEAFEGPMAGHEPGMPWHYDKHVWAWDTNPSGMFSQWNPSISCL